MAEHNVCKITRLNLVILDKVYTLAEIYLALKVSSKVSDVMFVSNAWFPLEFVGSLPHFIAQNLVGTPKVLCFKFVTQNESR